MKLKFCVATFYSPCGGLGKNMMSFLKIVAIQEKAVVHTLVFRNEVRNQDSAVIEHSTEKFHLQIMISNVDQSSFKTSVVLCTEKERENRGLHRKMSIESRKRFIKAHKNTQVSS